MQQSGSWWLGSVVWEYRESGPPVCVLFLTLEQQSAAHHFTAVLSYVVVPRLAAVWMCLWKSSLFHFGPMSSDILQTTKAIITDWWSLWDKPGCHGDVNGRIRAWETSTAMPINTSVDPPGQK